VVPKEIKPKCAAELLSDLNERDHKHEDEEHLMQPSLTTNSVFKKPAKAHNSNFTTFLNRCVYTLPVSFSSSSLLLLT